MCVLVKNTFGHSFNEESIKNLVNLKDISPEDKNKFISGCIEILEKSHD
jgi:hypothetical protein